jgi:UPF0176 protein
MPRQASLQRILVIIFVKILVAAFYSIQPLKVKELADLKSFLKSRADELGIMGMTILSPEGMNSTMSGEEDNLKLFLSEIDSKYFPKTPQFKLSWSETHPFRRFSLKFRSEIVTADFEPSRNLLKLDIEKGLISPAKFRELLKKKDEVTVIDTRNDYEVMLGKFEGAIDPEIQNFKQFSEFLDKAELPKDKPTLIYCTGGIRCEKAVAELKAKGFREVYQLEGGILNYIEQFPNDGFEGECFVFDKRVAVNQELKPTDQYVLSFDTGFPIRKEN